MTIVCRAKTYYKDMAMAISKVAFSIDVNFTLLEIVGDSNCSKYHRKCTCSCGLAESSIASNFI